MPPGIDAANFAEQYRAVPLAPQNASQGSRNVCRREAAGRDLVEQRLKKMEIAAIDQGDVDGSTMKRPSHFQTAESSSHDDNTMGLYGSLHHGSI